jgi:hypothetical protein
VFSKNRSSSMPVADRPTPEPAGRIPVWAILAASVAIYGCLAFWFPLLPNVDRAPPADIRTFAPTIQGGLLYAMLLMTLFGLFAAVHNRVKAIGMGPRPLLVILAGSLVMALPLLFTYPVNATDVLRYIIRGRIASVYGESPYVAPPAAFIGDPFMPLAGEWAGETSPYGPVWELVAAGLTALSGDSLPGGVLLFKGVAVACFLAVAVLIWSFVPNGPARPAAAMLWAWNPALLLTFAVNGHNDALMLMWLVLGLWLMRRDRPVTGFVVMMLAVLTKPVALLGLPFFWLGALRRTTAGPARLRFVVGSLGGAALIAWLAFLPWAGAGVLRVPFELGVRLLREATGGASFSPAVWLYVILGGRVSIETIGLAGTILFVVLALWLLWRGWRGRSSLRGAADVFFAYVATALNFRIWYAVWPFPWLLLDAGADHNVADSDRAAYRLRVGLWFLLTSQLSVVIYGHLRVYALGGDQVAAHLIGVPFVFALPWALGLIRRISRTIHVA